MSLTKIWVSFNSCKLIIKVILKLPEHTTSPLQILFELASNEHHENVFCCIWANLSYRVLYIFSPTSGVYILELLYTWKKWPNFFFLIVYIYANFISEVLIYNASVLNIQFSVVFIVFLQIFCPVIESFNCKWFAWFCGMCTNVDSVIFPLWNVKIM